MFKAKELLEAKGHEVIPFSTNFNQNDQSEYSEYFCEYYNLSLQGFSRRPKLNNLKATANMFFNREAYGKMKKLIEKTRPDIVQGFGVTKHLSYSIFKAAKDAGVPTVMRLSDFALLCPNSTATDHSGELCPEFSCSQNKCTKILTQKCIHNSTLASMFGLAEVKYNQLFETYNKYIDYFIAPSRFLRDIFMKHYNLSPDRIIYIPIFETAEENEKDINYDNYFIFAGRLSHEKGVTTLLEAQNKIRSTKLVLAGTGPFEETYKDYANKNGLNVVFKGHINFESLKNLIKNCRAVIVPSKCYENSPNIVLEAYSHKKPVIGARIGGIPELIDENRTGFLFESGSVEGLAERMKKYHNDEMLSQEMGRQGYDLLKARFTPERHYERLEKLYNSVVKKKILMVNNFYYNRGGDCTYLFGLKNILEAKGHNVSVFSMNHPQNFTSKWSKYFVNYINYDEEVKQINFRSGIKVASRTIYFISARKRLEKLIREERPHIAHLHNIHHHITPSILYALRKYKIPVVWTLHDYQLICPNIHFIANGKICERCKKHRYYWPPLIRCKKGSLAASLMSSIEIVIHNLMGIERLVKLFISPSNFLRNKFIEFGFKERKIRHVAHFVETIASEKRQTPGDFYLFVGRISEEKGLKTLIDAAIKVNAGKLKIIGSGPLLEEMMRHAKKIDKNNLVEFLGHKSRDEVYEFMHECKFLIVPSEWYETSGLVILEAFSCGKPVIASRIGGIPELVDENRTGLTFEMGNVEQLREKISYMLNNPEAVENMGNNALAFVRENATSQKYYQALLEIYSEVSQ